SGSAIENGVSVALQRREQSRIARTQIPLKPTFGRNQGALIGGKCRGQSLGRWGTAKREVKEVDVVGIAAQSIFGFRYRDAHLSPAKRAQRLVLEARQSAIPHQFWKVSDIDERGRIALAASAAVGDAHLPRLSERIFGTVTAGTRRSPRARQARVEEQLL